MTGWEVITVAPKRGAILKTFHWQALPSAAHDHEKGVAPSVKPCWQCGLLDGCNHWLDVVSVAGHGGSIWQHDKRRLQRTMSNRKHAPRLVGQILERRFYALREASPSPHHTESSAAARCRPCRRSKSVPGPDGGRRPTRALYKSRRQPHQGAFGRPPAQPQKKTTTYSINLMMRSSSSWSPRNMA